jgi:hypothetical protein
VTAQPRGDEPPHRIDRHHLERFDLLADLHVRERSRQVGADASAADHGCHHRIELAYATDAREHPEEVLAAEPLERRVRLHREVETGEHDEHREQRDAADARLVRLAHEHVDRWKAGELGDERPLREQQELRGDLHRPNPKSAIETT